MESLAISCRAEDAWLAADTLIGTHPGGLTALDAMIGNSPSASPPLRQNQVRRLLRLVSPNLSSAACGCRVLTPVPFAFHPLIMRRERLQVRLGGRRLDAHLVSLGTGQHVFASCAPGTDLREEDYLELLWQCQVGVAVSLHATKVRPSRAFRRPSRAVESAT